MDSQEGILGELSKEERKLLDHQCAHITCEILYIKKLYIRQGNSITKSQKARLIELMKKRKSIYRPFLFRQAICKYANGQPLQEDQFIGVA